MKKLFILVLLLGMAGQGICQPQINTPSFPSSVNLFDKFEVSFSLSNNPYSNPYDSTEVFIEATFCSPDNRTYNVSAFYYESYMFTNNDLVEIATKEQSRHSWKVRFTPNQVGTWTFTIKGIDANGIVNLPNNGTSSYTFTCNATNYADGFISRANTRFLKRDVVRDAQRSFKSFFPVGPNVAWYSCNYYQGDPIYSQSYGIYDYQRYIDSLTGNANYMRIWLNRYQHLSLYGPEFTQIDGQGDMVVYFDSTVNQKDSAELDYIIEYAAQHGIAIMPCVFSFGDFRSYNNDEPDDPSIWSNNPFSTISGIDGPCCFFSNETAKRITKNLLRYIVSRWGYATNIMCWELWNEVSNMFKECDDGTGQLQASVLSWHNEMASYIRSCDPYNHCISTSMGTTGKTCDSALVNYNDSLYLSLFDTLDIVMQHNYQNINKAKSPEQFSKVLYDKTMQAHTKYPTKPFFMGEFAFGQYSLYAEKDTFGIDLHNSLWSSLFSTAIGPASMWWWQYLNNCRLFHNRYSALLTFCQNMPILSRTFSAYQTGEKIGHKLVFPNNIETYYMINAAEDTIYGWCQDTAFAYQSLRWLTDSVEPNTDSTFYLHFIDSVVFDSLGYVYKLTNDKRPAPSSGNNFIDIIVSNQPIGATFNLIWYNTETGLPYFNYLIQFVSVRLNELEDKVIRIYFPNEIRDLKRNTITNIFGDAVFVLTKTSNNPSN